YNVAHGIIPQTIVKEVRDIIAAVLPQTVENKGFQVPESMKRSEREKLIRSLEKEMREAAHRLEFEEAAQLRDAIMELRVAGRDAARA
ncbi:MAG: UvrB/UvrC motif-containing protein, partial [Clostridiales bacterium]